MDCGLRAFLLTCIGFLWDRGDRRDETRERITASLIEPRVYQDTMFTVDLVLWNVGKKSALVRLAQVSVELPDSAFDVRRVPESERPSYPVIPALTLISDSTKVKLRA
jgi:hypothetical protein